jgi:hypothetical protein
MSCICSTYFFYLCEVHVVGTLIVINFVFTKSLLRCNASRQFRLKRDLHMLQLKLLTFFFSHNLL